MLEAQEARTQFKKIDTNRDGYITFDEFKTDLQRNPKVTDSEVQQIIRMADHNDDDRLDVNEYVKLVSRNN